MLHVEFGYCTICQSYQTRRVLDPVQIVLPLYTVIASRLVRPNQRSSTVRLVSKHSAPVISRNHNMESTLKTAQPTEQANQLKPTRCKFTNQLPRTFLPTHPPDLARFQETCEQLWQMLVLQDCKDSNYPFYHSCCNSFSRKRYAQGDHFHPPEQTHKMKIWLKFQILLKRL